MLKITTIKTDRRLRFVLDGEMIAPWVEELYREWRKASGLAKGLPTVVDLRNVLTIGDEGKDLLLLMISRGVKFICGGILNRHVLQQLSRKSTHRAGPVSEGGDRAFS